MVRSGAAAPIDVRDARRLFPATAEVTYFNTAATGLASRSLIEAYHRCVDTWAGSGFDYVKAEEAGEFARSAVAGLVGSTPEDIALTSSVSSAAGLVASQFGPAAAGSNLLAQFGPLITRHRASTWSTETLAAARCQS